MIPTFRQVYEQWLREGQTRNAEPWRPKTVKTYKEQAVAILASLGDLPINVVGNKQLNQFVDEQVANGAAPSSIGLKINIIKGIREFLTDDDGQPVYPVKWSRKIIDAPTVDKKRQKRPVLAMQAVAQAVCCLGKASTRTQALLALLAGSGLRIQEAMAVRIGPSQDNETWWDSEASKIIVRDQRNDDGTFGPTKTGAGEREVDLCSALNDYLKSVVTLGVGHDAKFAFTETESTYRTRITKCLKDQGIKFEGFHSVRRARVTHLQGLGIPEAMIRFWTGHDDSSVTGRYTEVGTLINQRKELAEKAGLGFTI